MKNNKTLLAICIAIPLLVGSVSALLTGEGMAFFAQLNKPPLSPPGWLFPVVWTVLYTLMGVSSYLILTGEAEKGEKEDGLKKYGYQLLFNFLWPTFFFNFRWYFFSFIWLGVLWYLVFWMLVKFREIRPVAAYMNIPYLAWLTFAAYLNIAIWQLNR